MSYVLKCSNCNKTLITYEGRERKYGSPFFNCKKCGTEYVDPRYQELAVVGIPESEFGYGTSIICLVIGGLLLWRGIYLLGVRMLGTPDFMQWVLPTMVLILGGAFVVMAIVDFVSIVSGGKRKKFERLYEESLARMQDEAYVEKLKKCGCIK